MYFGEKSLKLEWKGEEFIFNNLHQEVRKDTIGERNRRTRVIKDDIPTRL